LTQNKGKLGKILIITLVFEENANFFRRKLAKIAENCDHNIDPRFKATQLLFATLHRTLAAMHKFIACQEKKNFQAPFSCTKATSYCKNRQPMRKAATLTF
jgi:hypothetical protein